MRIVISCEKVGLGNNGGSKSVILSASTLIKLGNDVVIFSPVNKYTWGIPNNVKISSNEKDVVGDIILATGFASTNHVLQSKIKKKYYWIRGFELWNTSEDNLIKSYKSLKCIVNSSWLQNYLKSKGIHSELIYQGFDFDKFYNLGQKRENILGGLFSSKHKTKRHEDVVAVGKMLNYKTLLLNRDIVNPNEKELNKWYNKIKVWCFASELEGLTNTPVESSLCGTGLVCTNHPRAGVNDYAINNKTCLMYQARNIKEACQNVEKLMKDDILREQLNKNMIELLKKKIGDRKTNMKKMLELFK